MRMQKNPTDVVSGLRALVTGVLSFPKNELTNEQQTYFQEILGRLPEIPLAQKDGYTVLPPAENLDFGKGSIKHGVSTVVYTFPL